MENYKIPKKSVERLSIYKRILKGIMDAGFTTVSSRELAERAGLNSAQVRKDLVYFGQFGTPGMGYHVSILHRTITKIMGLHKKIPVALIGVGNLGQALLSYQGFKERGFIIESIFDNDREKVGKIKNGLKIMDERNISIEIKKKNIRVGIITIPSSAAQSAANKLIKGGIKGILNFAPIELKVPSRTTVVNVALCEKLEMLSYYLSKRKLL
ncbi:redox-sensing transcriptional repressor Rex [bacterium]|nr:redox-sensing transcriptional repressor Rex [bacterium]